MFRGNANVSLDQRGRFAMPTRYREALLELSGGQLVVTIDVTQTCLLIYPKPNYQALEEKLIALDNTRPRNRDLQRKIIGFATDVELDGNGRVLVSNELREYAGLDRKATLLGQVNKLEMWSDDLWREIKTGWRKDHVGVEEQIDLRGSDIQF